MFFGVIFLVLFVRIPQKTNSQRTCAPNTYLALNDRLCVCDHQGRLNEANCKYVAQQKPCPPGQVIWQGCNHCVCQGNGELKCTSAFCSHRITKQPNSSAEYGSKCTPFRSYYVNCGICFCPASGQVSNAQCIADATCSFDNTSDVKTISERPQCIPNVTYIFPCIQCLCSELGFFVLDKCLEKCHQTQSKHRRRCTPGTLYRRDCDVCRCPNNGITDEKLCIASACKVAKNYLQSLRSSSNFCSPRTFTKPKCIYCDCSSEGTVNEHSCLELDCSKIPDFEYYPQADVCTFGELVPICMECFCLNNGLTNESYCTRTCSYQSKLKILEKVLNDSKVDKNLIDKTKIKEVQHGDACKPSTLHIHNGKYCLCSDNDDKNKFCTNIIEGLKHKHVISKKIKFDTSASCEPGTLAHIDCNTCYCSKERKIEPKWCTYDDCEAKRIVMESHKILPNSYPFDDPNGVCTPGSISKVKCNFCICPENGVLKDRACTKNDCSDDAEVTSQKLFCEPLAYYEVDCNICLCPRDGLKNVAKCTKNQCEKSFLRSETCTPGHLFSDACNVCVCPPNGHKSDRVCTNNTCGLTQWVTFKTNSLLENEIHDDVTRNLDFCFPGDEFSRGCHLCVCPDLGLKVYASCEPILCDENVPSTDVTDILDRSGKLVILSTPFII